jgi:hypothetical protein
MWIDMTDPYLIWKKLSEAIYENFPAKPGKESYALDLVIFFLNSFKLNDEEMQHLHIPMFLLFLLTRIQVIRCHRSIFLKPQLPIQGPAESTR